MGKFVSFFRLCTVHHGRFDGGFAPGNRPVRARDGGGVIRDAAQADRSASTARYQLNSKPSSADSRVPTPFAIIPSPIVQSIFLFLLRQKKNALA